MLDVWVARTHALTPKHSGGCRLWAIVWVAHAHEVVGHVAHCALREPIKILAHLQHDLARKLIVWNQGPPVYAWMLTCTHKVSVQSHDKARNHHLLHVSSHSPLKA